jgi:methylthioribulose-1-phosphate dehydratase
LLCHRGEFFRARVDSDLIAITVSGKHKGELTTNDVMLVDTDGKSIIPGKKPSAETALHTLVYRQFSQTGAVLHTHSVNGTVLSRLLAPKKALVTEGYEIHKAFQGIKTHESTLTLPIFENSQDYIALSAEIDDYLQTHPQTYGFFLRGHGLYTWGKDLNEAKIRTEAFEFLFACELKTLSIGLSCTD